MRHRWTVCTYFHLLNAAYNAWSVVQSSAGMERSLLLAKTLSRMPSMPRVILWLTSGMKSLTEERWSFFFFFFVFRSQNQSLLSLFRRAHFYLNEQVKKIKSYKKEKWRGSSIFQKVQDRRNKWSLQRGGQRVFGIRRWVGCWGLTGQIPWRNCVTNLQLYSFKKKRILQMSLKQSDCKTPRFRF